MAQCRFSTDEDTWDRTIAVNLKSIYLVSKYAIPHIIEAGGGSVINAASVQAQACLPNSAAYVASKGGVLALTREMALDFAPQNVRVNAILPGSINTPMLQFAAGQEAEPDTAKVFQEWGEKLSVGSDWYCRRSSGSGGFSCQQRRRLYHGPTLPGGRWPGRQAFLAMVSKYKTSLP